MRAETKKGKPAFVVWPDRCRHWFAHPGAPSIENYLSALLLTPQEPRFVLISLHNISELRHKDPKDPGKCPIFIRFRREIHKIVAVVYSTLPHHYDMHD